MKHEAFRPKYLSHLPGMKLIFLHFTVTWMSRGYLLDSCMDSARCPLRGQSDAAFLAACISCPIVFYATTLSSVASGRTLSLLEHCLVDTDSLYCYLLREAVDR